LRDICERENFVFDSLIYLEPVERFENMSNMITLRSFGDSTSSRVKDKLKTIFNQMFIPNKDKVIRIWRDHQSYAHLFTSSPV